MPVFFYRCFFFSILLNLALVYSNDQNSSYSHERNLPYKVGLVIVATGKYINFVPPLIASAKKYFCPNQDVTFFVFTDGELACLDNVCVIKQERLGWPFDTLLCCSMYAEQKDILSSMDFLFSCDADMLFVDTVGDEILSESVATLHPGFVGKRGTYEKRKRSKAYVSRREGLNYFAGGFYGGKSSIFLRIAETMAKNIKADYEKGIIAIWHDESHLNRFFIDNPPSLILSPSYCYPENWRNLNYEKKLVALDKNHEEMRRLD